MSSAATVLTIQHKQVTVFQVGKFQLHRYLELKCIFSLIVHKNILQTLETIWLDSAKQFCNVPAGEP